VDDLRDGKPLEQQVVTVLERGPTNLRARGQTVAGKWKLRLDGCAMNTPTTGAAQAADCLASA
jgi:hypothetical protein